MGCGMLDFAIPAKRVNVPKWNASKCDDKPERKGSGKKGSKKNSGIGKKRLRPGAGLFCGKSPVFNKRPKVGSFRSPQSEQQGGGLFATSPAVTSPTGMKGRNFEHTPSGNK